MPGTQPAGDDAQLDEQVRYAVGADGVARITINRPDAGNSLTAAMRDRMRELFDLASDDLAVRAVLVTGSGERHFCTGAGLGGPQPPGPARPEAAPDRVAGDVARMIRRGWQRLVGSILDCEKPVVAAVNGTAAGGGAQLVLAADLVLMADSARFIEVFVRRGIMPDAGGAYLLPRVVGMHRAKELLLLGDEIDAHTAERYGIANRVVPAADLEAESAALAGRLANGPTRALATTKRLLNSTFESGRQAAFEEEAFGQDLVATTADMAEGMKAFMERRDPDFGGW